MRELLPESLVQCGIAEQSQVAIAAALANEGYTVVAPAYASFITARCFDQIRVCLGSMGAPVVLVGIAGGYGSGILGPTHLALNDVALMRTVQGMTVICPSDNAGLWCCLRELVARPRPAYVRMEVKLYEGVESDPSVETVMKGAQFMSEFGPDWIIAIGGGSPIDAAKAMWIKYEYPECTFEDMCKVFGLPELRKKAHFCAISSTSGTATEVTAFSIITDYEKGIKFPIADFEITPDVAIVDPELTYTMRAVTRLDKIEDLTVTIDCDVIQADGGTRTASITGAWVALHDALMARVEANKLNRLPLTGQVAAISMGVVGGELLLDLDYPEDSHADVDMNLVGTDTGGIVEVQGTGERALLDREQLNDLLDMGQAGIARLIEIQNQVTGFRG